MWLVRCAYEHHMNTLNQSLHLQYWHYGIAIHVILIKGDLKKALYRSHTVLLRDTSDQRICKMNAPFLRINVGHARVRHSCVLPLLFIAINFLCVSLFGIRNACTLRCRRVYANCTHPFRTQIFGHLSLSYTVVKNCSRGNTNLEIFEHSIL